MCTQGHVINKDISWPSLLYWPKRCCTCIHLNTCHESFTWRTNITFSVLGIYFFHCWFCLTILVFCLLSYTIVFSNFSFFAISLQYSVYNNFISYVSVFVLVYSNEALIPSPMRHPLIDWKTTMNECYWSFEILEWFCAYSMTWPHIALMLWLMLSECCTSFLFHLTGCQFAFESVCVTYVSGGVIPKGSSLCFW